MVRLFRVKFACPLASSCADNSGGIRPGSVPGGGVSTGVAQNCPGPITHSKTLPESGVAPWRTVTVASTGCGKNDGLGVLVSVIVTGTCGGLTTTVKTWTAVAPHPETTVIVP